VRFVHGDDELQQIGQSHAPGEARDEMLADIMAFHECVRASNPRWLLNLLSQFEQEAPPGVTVEPSPRLGAAAEERPLRLSELRQLAQRHSPWWVNDDHAATMCAPCSAVGTATDLAGIS
jgi:hypothetical protein